MSVSYTVRNKGGSYRLIGLATGAGTSRGKPPVVLYECLDTGQMYYREQGDFTERLEPVLSTLPTPPPMQTPTD